MRRITGTVIRIDQGSTPVTMWQQNENWTLASEEDLNVTESEKKIALAMGEDGKGD